MSENISLLDTVDDNFKKIFIKIIAKNNSYLKDDLERCTTYKDIQKTISLNIEDIADDFNYECDDCTSKDATIHRLGIENDELNEKVIEWNIDNENLTLWDVEKIHIFNQFKNNYTPWQLEQLFKQGL